jgi:hypothetical protein
VGGQGPGEQGGESSGSRTASAPLVTTIVAGRPGTQYATRCAASSTTAVPACGSLRPVTRATSAWSRVRRWPRCTLRPYRQASTITVSAATIVVMPRAKGTCFYWLHIHAPDGIIHIESPVQRTYSLGDFFDEWRQPLGPNQVGPARGHVTAIYNGRVYQGNPRNIPLGAHAQIQLEVGRPLVAPESITWPSGL